MRLRSLISLLAVAAASIALVACNGDEDAEGTPAPIVPTASITLTASPEPTDSPVSNGGTPSAGDPRRTGDPDLDAIIEAVEARDIASLAPLVEYTEVGCTFAQGLGGPPKCVEGQEEGEVVREFPFASCEGSWTRTATQLLGFAVADAAGLYAAAEVAGDASLGGAWPNADSLLTFHAEGQVASGFRLHIADGRIVALWLGCGAGQPIADLVDAGVEGNVELIAGPWDEPLPVTDPVPTTGIEAVNAVLAAVANYEWFTLREGALEAMESLPDFACEEPPLQGPGGVECDPKNGETAGTEVNVFPLAYCEGALVRDPMDALRGFLDDVPQLYAVVEAPSEPSQSDLYPHGAYWLVYELANAEGGVQSAARLHVTEDGNVTALWYGCNPPVEELVQWSGEPLAEIEVREE